MAEITFARRLWGGRPTADNVPFRDARRESGGYCWLATRAISRASSRVDRAKKEDLPASERKSRNSAGAAIRRRDATRRSAS